MGRHEPGPELDRIAHEVIGAAIEVHRALGPGYHESVYHKAMIIALRKRGLFVESKKPFTVLYEGEVVGTGEFDLLVEGKLVLELKAVSKLAPVHDGQIRHYMKAGRYELGLLLNFHEAVMIDGIKRVIQTMQP